MASALTIGAAATHCGPKNISTNGFESSARPHAIGSVAVPT
jgi:hypothetical protein